MRGIFIVMEGPDGSGKTTQITLLKEYFEEKGYDCLITREPGGTAIGESLRSVILNPDHGEMSPVTEMLLYAACRAQLIHEVIAPALKEGQIPDRHVLQRHLFQTGAFGQTGEIRVSRSSADGQPDLFECLGGEVREIKRLVAGDRQFRILQHRK